MLFAFGLNASFVVVEIVGGVLTNSLAVISSAIHDLGDSLSLLGAYVTERLSHRRPDERRTFGYRRLALMAAYANSTVLLLGSVYVILRALPRLLAPEPLHSAGVLGLSLFGIGFNALGVLRLRHGRSLTERILRWHLLEDVFGWVAIAITGAILLVWELPILDPLLTLLFAAIILVNVGRNVRQILNLFLEGAPRAGAVAELTALLRAHPGVASVHDVHVWSLDGEQDLLSAHVVPGRGTPAHELLRALKRRARAASIEHAVFEIESEGKCAGGMERRAESGAQPPLLAPLLFVVGNAFRSRTPRAGRTSVSEAPQSPGRSRKTLRQ